MSGILRTGGIFNQRRAMMKWFPFLGVASAILTGCSSNPPPAPSPKAKVEVHAPGVDVKVGQGNVDVKAPGADVEVDRKK